MNTYRGAHNILNLFAQIGDIGIVPSDVERNMDNHFRLANRWGCVLLLDEADVFLAKRDVSLRPPEV